MDKNVHQTVALIRLQGKKRLKSLILRIIFAVFLPACAFAGYIPTENNDSSGSTGLPDGIWHSKPGNPAIQWCIDHASNGDTILVYPGTYYEHLDFLGKAIVVKGVAGAAETVIDGGGTGSVITYSSGEDTTSVIEGLTLRNGCGKYYGGNSWAGGGINSSEASFKVLKCIISDNIVGSIDGLSSGGGLYVYACPYLVIQDSKFIRNQAGRGGGGRFYTAKGMITGCLFEGNIAFGEIDGGITPVETAALFFFTTAMGLLSAATFFRTIRRPRQR